MRHGFDKSMNSWFWALAIFFDDRIDILHKGSILLKMLIRIIQQNQNWRYKLNKQFRKLLLNTGMSNCMNKLINNLTNNEISET